jgi:ketosteroid isomerase-like protein
MNRQGHWWSAVGVVLVSVASLEGQGSRSLDETSIRAQIAAYAEARRGGDGKVQAKYYAKDADSYFSGTRRWSRGSAELERELALPADPNRQFRIEVQSISFVGQVALVDTEFFGASAEPTGHAFYVMVQEGGQWLIRSARTARFAVRTATGR